MFRSCARRPPPSGELRRTWDTSALAPFVTRTYEIRVRSGVGAWNDLDAAALERHTREQGSRIGRELIARAAPDIEAALGRLPRRVAVASSPVASPTPAAIPPSTAPVAAGWQGAVRSHIDARRTLVLACTSGASVAVRATWQPGSTLTYAVVGSDSTEVRECIQSALGSLTAPADVIAGTVLHAVAP